MGWDSNPRRAFTLAGFQDQCLQPLGHPSSLFKTHKNASGGCLYTEHVPWAIRLDNIFYVCFAELVLAEGAGLKGDDNLCRMVEPIAKGPGDSSGESSNTGNNRLL
jgi:hypothetical protein